MKGNKRWLLALLAGMMALSLTACGQPDEEKSGASQMPAQELTGSKRAEEHTYEEATDLNYEDWLDYGWHWATTEELKETTWITQEYDRNYSLEFYGNGDGNAYDGEAVLVWWEGEEIEPQESYSGWWALEEIDGTTYLCLDVIRLDGQQYQEGEDPVAISDRFPAILSEETTDLILGKSQDGARFPWQETAAQTGMLIRSYG